MIEFERVAGQPGRGMFPNPQGVSVEGRLTTVKLHSLQLQGASAIATAATEGLEVEVLCDCQPYPYPKDAVVYTDALIAAVRAAGHHAQADALDHSLVKSKYHPLGGSDHNFISLEPHEFGEL